MNLLLKDSVWGDTTTVGLSFASQLRQIIIIIIMALQIAYVKEENKEEKESEN
jgi:hypothetical protein